MTNAELADALTNFCNNARGDVNKDSLDCVKEAAKRILGIEAKDAKIAKCKDEVKRWKDGIKTTGFPSKEAIRMAQAIEDGLIQASNFTKYGDWKMAYEAFLKAASDQGVQDGFKWLCRAEG